MSRVDFKLPKRIECSNLLNKMGIKTNKFEIRGHHLFFKYEDSYIVCKIGNNILFDFIEFEDEEIAKEYFSIQREDSIIVLTKVKRKRENDICLRSLFHTNTF